MNPQDLRSARRKVIVAVFVAWFINEKVTLPLTPISYLTGRVSINFQVSELQEFFFGFGQFLGILSIFFCAVLMVQWALKTEQYVKEITTEAIL